MRRRRIMDRILPTVILEPIVRVKRSPLRGLRDMSDQGGRVNLCLDDIDLRRGSADPASVRVFGARVVLIVFARATGESLTGEVRQGVAIVWIAGGEDQLGLACGQGKVSGQRQRLRRPRH